jgi:ceroid-lipofuscinosis MFS transporter 7
MDPSAKLDFFGYVIAIYSIGQMFSSPLFGYWNQRTKSTKWPVLVGLTISSCGNLLYGLLPTIGTHVQLLMMIARFMVGFGSGIWINT